MGEVAHTILKGGQSRAIPDKFGLI